MILQDLSQINEAIGVWTLAGWLLVVLIIIVIIFYPITKIIQMRSYKKHSNKPRVKKGKKIKK